MPLTELLDATGDLIYLEVSHCLLETITELPILESWDRPETYGYDIEEYLLRKGAVR